MMCVLVAVRHWRPRELFCRGAVLVRIPLLRDSTNIFAVVVLVVQRAPPLPASRTLVISES